MNVVAIFKDSKKVWYSMFYVTDKEKEQVTNDINKSAVQSGFDIEIQYMNDDELQNYVSTQ